MANLSVGLGEIKFSNNLDDIIIAHGLGSCIGVAMYDPITRAAAMVHVVLPDNKNKKNNPMPGRFASTAIPTLFGIFKQINGEPLRSIVKIAGGANIFNNMNLSTTLDIGQRNFIAVKKALMLLGLSPINQDVGGHIGRTFKLHVQDGTVTVKKIGKQEQTL